MDNNSIRDALVKVAYRKELQSAFVDELVAIDPAMEKVAWRWAKRMGRKAWGGIKRAGRWVAKNPLDAALTATMFIPGANVIGGLGRAAVAGYRGYRALNAGRKAIQATRAAVKAGNTVKATQLASKAKNLGNVANKFKAQAGTALRSANPLNRGGMGYGKYTPGNSFKAIGQAGGGRSPLWQGGKLLKQGPMVSGRTRQGFRLVGTGLGAQGVYSAATNPTATPLKDAYNAFKGTGGAGGRAYGSGNYRGGATYGAAIQNVNRRR